MCDDLRQLSSRATRAHICMLVCRHNSAVAVFSLYFFVVSQDSHPSHPRPCQKSGFDLCCSVLCLAFKLISFHQLMHAAGTILRSTIVKLLQHRIGFYVDDANGHLPPPKSHIPTTQKASCCCPLHVCLRKAWFAMV